jgi:hypothetical protein
MLQRFFATGLALSCFFMANAQQSAAPADASAPTTTTAPAKKLPTLTGAADAYFRYDLGETAANAFTSFTHSHNSFELGMISLKAEHSVGKVGMVADVGFGKRAEEFSYADDNTRFVIKQLYLTYTVKNKVKFTAGSWATHIGYELVDAYGNRNYSMSYMFSYGPFFHTGLKAETSFGKNGFMLGIANPTDLKSTDFGKKYLIAQYSVASQHDKLKIYLNFQGGKPNDSTKVAQLDVVATQTLSDQFSIGINGTMSNWKSKAGSDDFKQLGDWWGAALYLNYDPVAWMGLTLRSEYFSDDDRLNVFAAQTKGGHVLATTLSANFKVENSLTIIPEIRFEQASEDLYVGSSDRPTNTATSFLVAAVYKF